MINEKYIYIFSKVILDKHSISAFYFIYKFNNYEIDNEIIRIYSN